MAPLTALDWPVPDGVVVTTVCAGTWQLATPDCPNPRREVFTRDTVPTTYDTTADAPAAQNGAPAVAPLVVRSPANGAVLRPPFVIAGTSSPGAMVTIVVTAEGTGGGARAAEVAMQTTAEGQFTYEFRPPTRSPGARYVIAISVVSLNGGRASRILTVYDSPGQSRGR
jgi:hypothetical protein